MTFEDKFLAEELLTCTTNFYDPLDGVASLPLNVFTQRLNYVAVNSQKRQTRYSSHPLEDLGVTYALMWLTERKPVVDFLFVMNCFR